MTSPGVVAALAKRVDALEMKTDRIAAASARAIRELVQAAQKLDRRIDELEAKRRLTP